MNVTKGNVNIYVDFLRGRGGIRNWRQVEIFLNGEKQIKAYEANSFWAMSENSLSIFLTGGDD